MRTGHTVLVQRLKLIGAHALDCAACMVQVGIPEMISFAAIIFKDDIYTQYLDQLAKLAFLGSAMHQFVFTLVSSLPYAVAQVPAAMTAAAMLRTSKTGIVGLSCGKWASSHQGALIFRWPCLGLRVVRKALRCD